MSGPFELTRVKKSVYFSKEVVVLTFMMLINILDIVLVILLILISMNIQKLLPNRTIFRIIFVYNVKTGTGCLVHVHVIFTLNLGLRRYHTYSRHSVLKDVSGMFTKCQKEPKTKNIHGQLSAFYEDKNYIHKKALGFL